MNETYEEQQLRETKQEEAFQGLMAQVPAHLGDGYSWIWNNLERDGQMMRSNGYLIGPNEAKIGARLDIWHNRIDFHSCYPNCYPVSHGKIIEITVSPTKTPERIAKDLKGRFIDLYIPELIKHQERIKEHTRYEDSRKAMMDRIADYLGAGVHENGNVYPDEIKAVYSVEAYGEDTVRFEVKCTAEQAIKVFEVLKEI